MYFPELTSLPVVELRTAVFAQAISPSFFPGSHFILLARAKSLPIYYTRKTGEIKAWGGGLPGQLDRKSGVGVFFKMSIPFKSFCEKRVGGNYSISGRFKMITNMGNIRYVKIANFHNDIPSGFIVVKILIFCKDSSILRSVLRRISHGAAVWTFR